MFSVIFKQYLQRILVLAGATLLAACGAEGPKDFEFPHGVPSDGEVAPPIDTTVEPILFDRPDDAIALVDSHASYTGRNNHVWLPDLVRTERVLTFLDLHADAQHDVDDPARGGNREPCATVEPGRVEFDCTFGNTTIAGFVEVGDHSVDAAVLVANEVKEKEAAVRACFAFEPTIDGGISKVYQSPTVNLIADVAFEDVALNDHGCPVGGTITATANIDDENGERFSSKSVSFGPECGDVFVVQDAPPANVQCP